MKDRDIKEVQKGYEFTEVEIAEIKKTAQDDTLFRFSTLLTLKSLDKKVDETNGTVRTHIKEIATLKTSRTFQNWAMGIYAAVVLFILKILYGIN